MGFFLVTGKPFTGTLRTNMVEMVSSKMIMALVYPDLKPRREALREKPVVVGKLIKTEIEEDV